jgi:hypothetical protein
MSLQTHVWLWKITNFVAPLLKKRSLSIGNFNKINTGNTHPIKERDELKSQMTSRSLHTLLNDSNIRQRAEKSDERMKKSSSEVSHFEWREFLSCYISLSIS